MYQLKISNQWLLARHESALNLSSFSQCMCFGDIFDLSTNQLVLADFSQYFEKIHSNLGYSEFKVKAFKGTKLISEIAHSEAPSGIITFKCREKDKIVSDLAVAAGPYIYVYRKLSPFYKYNLPVTQPLSDEFQLWEQAREGQLTAEELRTKLGELKHNLSKLSPRSIRYLQLPLDCLHEFFNAHRVSKLEKQTVATCISCMSKQHCGPNSWDCLIVGTESSFIYIYDCVSHNILTQNSLPSVPVHINAVGSYDIDYHILVTCRNGIIYSIKRGEDNVKAFIDLGSQIIGLVRTDKVIIIACMDQTVKGFSLKGRPIWRVRHSCEILTLAPMNFMSSNNRNNEIYYILCLSDGSVNIYCDQHLCDQCIVWIPLAENNNNDDKDNDSIGKGIPAKEVNKSQLNKLINYQSAKPDPIVACCFGKYDRELNTLVLISQGGHMFILIVKRSANFIPINVISCRTLNKLDHLNFPKKSKLFMDLTTREQLNASQMYRQFIHDMCFTKRSVASTFLNILESHSTPIPISGYGEQIKLNVLVQGLGPAYILICDIIQIKGEHVSPVNGLFILISFNASIFRVNPVLIPLATVIPSLKYRYTSSVSLIRETFIEEEIKVSIVNNRSSSSIVSASVKVPISEPLIENI
ncbi:unnamed protein product [Trichobilharzia szidati]|nr:unnamed protein product [Trichobilharzia szidati]